MGLPDDDAMAERHEHGLVAYLDVLGARTDDLDRAEHLVTRLESLAIGAAERVKRDIRIGPVVGYDLAREVRNRMPEVRVFADTLAMVWPCDPDHALRNLRDVGAWAAKVFAGALLAQVSLRGAIGYGGFVRTRATALGPGVTDAANCEAKAEWLGVVASPDCASLCTQLDTSFGDRPRVVRPFIQYEVPVKGRRKEEMWAVNWPWELLVNVGCGDTGVDSGRPTFPQVLSCYDIPDSCWPKYVEAGAFFDHVTRPDVGTR